jgi:Fanconi anemia group M protein
MVDDLTQTAVRIVIDNRELKSRVPDLLKRLQNVQIQIERLPYGDYLVNGHLLIERKTVPDFSMSLTGGRLFRQVSEMGRFPYRRMLILEGRRFRSAGVSREAMQGAILALNLRFGVPVMQTADESETASVMIGAVKHVRINFDRPGFYGRSFGPQVQRDQSTPVDLLCRIPNIGRRRAGILIKHFGTVRNLFNAEPEQIRHCPGIGVGTAESIIKMVRRCEGKYA